MKLLAGLLGLVLALGVLWLAGEQHVQNCQDAHKTNCTVLPWSGNYATVPTVHLTPAEERAAARARRERDTLLREACIANGTC